MNSANDSADPDPLWHDLRLVLDEEVNRLPARYRAAIIACDLEGKSRQDAALDLAINQGTLSSRLSRGRELLARRLTRRGIALSTTAVASLVGSHAATAAPTASLISITTSAAISSVTGGTVAAGIVSAKAAILSEGVLKGMFIGKAKIVASLVLGTALTGTGVAVVTQIAFADKTDKATNIKPDNAAGKGKSDKSDYVKPELVGTVTGVANEGKQITIQDRNGGKGEPAVTGKATVQITATTEITFSSIAPMGDNVVVGYQAEVWLEANSQDRAARVAYSGTQNFKDPHPTHASGKITTISPDGKHMTVESRPQGEKGVKGAKEGEPVQADVNITPKTQIIYSAVSTDGTSLEKGYEAQVSFEREGQADAAVIRITGPEAAGLKGGGLGNADFSGRVVSVAEDGKSMMIEGRPVVFKGEPKEKNTGAVEVKTLKGEVKEKGAVAPGVKISKGEVNDKNAIAPEVKGQKGEAKVQNADGGKGKIEEPQQRIDVTITAATKMIFSGVAPGGATPTQGYRATVWLDGAAAKTVVFDATKERKGADLSSQVLYVSPDGRRVTLVIAPKNKGDQPEEREIDIAAAKIILNNVHPGQAKPAEGYQAQIWLDPTAPGTATVAMFNPNSKGKK